MLYPRKWLRHVKVSDSMKVLSLFDGMSCGAIAFRELGIDVDEYTAYEIDKYAVQVTQHNFPEHKQMGDVFKADFTQYKGVDWLIGGSPCTYWSISQNKEKRETVASGIGWELFSQYVRALHEAEPKFFLYENNKSMSNEIRKSITETFGFEPIMVNSALVSAQNRQRLYWVGVRQDDGTYRRADVTQPEDRGILLKDVLDGGMNLSQKDKSYTLTTRCQGAIPEDTLSKGRHTMVAEPINISEDGKSQTIKAQYCKNSVTNFVRHGTFGASGVAEPISVNDSNGKAQCIRATYYKDGIRNLVGNKVDRRTCVAEPVRVGSLPRPNGELSTSQAMRVYSDEGKGVGLKAGGGGMGGKTGLYAVPLSGEDSLRNKDIYEVREGFISIKGRLFPIKLADGLYTIRKLTVSECKRLQTVPDWYDMSVISNTQAYKCLGNGWTIEVIKHLIECAYNGTENKKQRTLKEWM